jgi:hypothetical protein
MDFLVSEGIFRGHTIPQGATIGHPVSSLEFSRTLSRMASRKACWDDGVPAEILKLSPAPFKENFLDLINLVFASDFQLPKETLMGKVIILHKKERQEQGELDTVWGKIPPCLRVECHCSLCQLLKEIIVKILNSGGLSQPIVAAHRERQGTLCDVLLQREVTCRETPVNPPPQELESPLKLPCLYAWSRLGICHQRERSRNVKRVSPVSMSQPRSTSKEGCVKRIVYQPELPVLSAAGSPREGMRPPGDASIRD